MSSVVHVFLTGICYLATTGTTPNVVSVVMPDASMARVAKAKDASGHHPIIPEHRAFIAVPHNEIGTDTTHIDPPDHFRAYVSGVDMDVYLLDHEQITLVYNHANSTKTLAFSGGDGSAPADPPDQTKRFDVTKLVDLRRDACPGCSSLPVEYVKVTAATKGKVAARLDIDDGVIAAAFISPGRTWMFMDNGPSRPLPQEAALDIATTDGYLTIQLDELLTTDRPGKLALTPYNNEPVSVVIGNSTIANIVGASPPMDIDVHFEHYYDLLASSSGQHIPRIGTRHPGGANCPPATISY